MTIAPHQPEPAADLTDADEDLVPLRVARRVMRRDVARLAVVVEGLAAGTAAFGERRALAVGEWTERVCEEIARHHDDEEALLWPVVERRGGATVDLSGLRDDHAALRQQLGQVRRGVRAVVAGLMVRPAAVATAADFARMRELASDLRDLGELLDEHLAQTERELADTTAGLPREARLRAVRGVCERVPDAGFAAVRALGVATPAEAAVLRRVLGPVSCLTLRATGVVLRRRERLAFGAG